MKLTKYLLVFSIMIIFSSLAFAFPGQYHRFWGFVTIDGVPAPDGLLIEAKINDNTFSTTTHGGTYGYAPYVFQIENNDGTISGLIEFYVSGTKVAEHYYNPNNPDTELDLIKGNVTNSTTGIEYDYFYGSVTIGDSIAPNNTLIEAKINDDVFSIEVIDGFYGVPPNTLYVSDISGSIDNVIEFYVDGIKVAEEVFIGGLTVELNLTKEVVVEEEPEEEDSGSSSSSRRSGGGAYIPPVTTTVDVNESEETNSTEGDNTEALGLDESDAVLCTPEWYCSDWEPCFNGRQSRTCVDNNLCGLEEGKPFEQQECDYVVTEADLPKEPFLNRITGFVTGGINTLAGKLVILALGALVIGLVYFKYNAGKVSKEL